MNLQTSFLTPPFGFSLFYLRGVAPPRVTTGMIYKGVVPFVILQLVGLAILFLWPNLATWLPGIVLLTRNANGPDRSRAVLRVSLSSVGSAVLKYFSRATRNGMSVPSVRVRSTLSAATKLSATFLVSASPLVADVGDELLGGLGARLEDLVGEAPDLHAVLADQRRQRPRVVGVDVGRHVVVGRLAGSRGRSPAGPRAAPGTSPC